MNRLHRFSIRHPVLVILIAAVATAAIAPGVLRLKLRTDGLALVPKSAPATLLNETVREEFGVGDLIVILIRSRHPEGIFNFHTLRLVRELTADLQRMDGFDPSDIASLATEPSDRFRPGTLSYFSLLEPFAETPRRLDILRDDLRANRLYDGTIVSYDKSATAIQVEVPPDADRVALYGSLKELVATKELTGETVDIIGAPVAEALLGRHILEDLGVPRALLGQSVTADGGADQGLPKSLYELRTLIGRHVGLVPIALLIMALVFLVSFRGVVAVALPLLEVGASLFAVFGLMGWFGVPVYLTIAVLPVILTAIALADEIHIFTRFAQERRRRPGDEVPDAVRATMEEMHRPVVNTSLTTSVGFLSFAISPIGPVSAFGIFMAVGILFCMLWSLTVIPALLVLLRPARFGLFGRGGNAGRRRGKRRLAEWLAETCARSRYVILGVAAIVVLATPLGIRKLTVQDSWIGGFSRESAFYKATQYFNEQFLGTHVLRVLLDTESIELNGRIPAEAVNHHQLRLPLDLASDRADELIGCRLWVARKDSGDASVRWSSDGSPRRFWTSRIDSVRKAGDHLVVGMPRTDGSPRFFLRPAPAETLAYEIRSRRFATPQALKLAAELESFVASQKEHTVGGVIGPSDYVSITNYIVKRRSEDADRVPDDPDRIQWLWEQYGRIRGADRLREIVDPDYRRALISVFMKNANFVDTAHLMKAIRGFEEERLAPHRIRLDFAGDVAVSQTLIDAIVATQIRSLLLSLVGILVIASLLGRSLRWGVYCAIPCALAVLINFAVMGWLDIPLGVATTMFAGMTLGIGIDFAIHLIHRYRLAVEHGLEATPAWSDAFEATGPAILISSVAVALGFGVLLLSQVPANARLAGVTIVCVTSCLVATLFLLPAISPGGRKEGPPGGGPV